MTHDKISLILVTGTRPESVRRILESEAEIALVSEIQFSNGSL